MEARNLYGETVLAAGAQYIENNTNNKNKMETVCLLIAAGADINAQGNYGQSPLSKYWATLDLLTAGSNIYSQLNDKPMAALNRPSMTRMRERAKIIQSQNQYKNFMVKGMAPISVEQVYELLLGMPLSDLKSPVDYIRNVRAIFAHVKWDNKEQAADILNEMQKDGMVNAETAQSILANTFPKELTKSSALQPRIGRGK